jgi:hypothetical protein
LGSDVKSSEERVLEEIKSEDKEMMADPETIDN